MNLIKRLIIKDIKEQLIQGNLVILTGARQVGKTSILKLLMQDLEKKTLPNSLFYFDLEKEDILEIFISYKTLINWLKLQGADLNKELYLFIDEFHYAPQPAKLLKILHDSYPNFRIVATGYSSLKIAQNIKESMAGRKRIFKIWPLSFEEFLEFKQSPLKEVIIRLKNDPASLVKPIAQDLLKEWEEFLLFGGYPKIVLAQSQAEKIKELEEIHDSYIQKDIKAFLKLENVLAYNKLIKILASQIANLFNFHTTAKSLGIARETLERYSFVLENTFIIQMLSPFFSNKQKEIVKMHKVFFVDTGIRNFAISDFKPMDLRFNAGSLAENGFFAELKKKQDSLTNFHFWRTQQKSEVDFVIERQGEIIPIEVKYKNFDSIKIPPCLKTFIKDYQPKKAFVLTKNFIQQVSFGGCNIQFLPIYLGSQVLNIKAQS